MDPADSRLRQRQPQERDRQHDLDERRQHQVFRGRCGMLQIDAPVGHVGKREECRLTRDTADGVAKREIGVSIGGPQ